jgi:hypothetical protein
MRLVSVSTLTMLLSSLYTMGVMHGVGSDDTFEAPCLKFLWKFILSDLL